MSINSLTYITRAAQQNSFRASATFRIFIKTILTLSIIAICCQTSSAQFNQGRMMVGGAVSFSSTNSKATQQGVSAPSTNINTFELTPKVGYFVIDNLAIGADVTLRTSSGASTSTSFLAGPFVRYYVKGLFIEAEYGIGSSKSSSSKATLSQWSAGLGYAIFVNDFVAIEPSVTYASSNVKYDDLNDKSTVAGFVVGVGLQIYLGKRD